MNQVFVPDRRAYILAVSAPCLLLMGINGLIKFLRAAKVVFSVRYRTDVSCKSR
jgi:hypothetical protein